VLYALMGGKAISGKMHFELTPPQMHTEPKLNSEVAKDQITVNFIPHYATKKLFE